MLFSPQSLPTFCGKMLRVKKLCGLLLHFIFELRSQRGREGEDQGMCEDEEPCQEGQKERVCVEQQKTGWDCPPLVPYKGPHYRSL